MKSDWLELLKDKAHSLQCSGEYPVWWDGFCDVLLMGANATDEHNRYDKNEPEHHQWKAGANAALSLIKHMGDEL